MSQSFSQAAASFLSNVIELGVCDEVTCCNSFYPLPDSFTDTIMAAAQARVADMAATSTSVASDAAYLCPLIPLPNALATDAAASMAATSAGTTRSFPTGAVGRQLTSSFAQLRVSLQQFIDLAFTAVSIELGVGLTTLLHALCLLERVQRANVLAHQQRGVLLRDSHSSSAAVSTPSEPPHVVLSSAPSSHSSPSSRHQVSPYQRVRCGTQHSPTSCSTVGPLTDAETATTAKVDLSTPALYLRLPPSETPPAAKRTSAPPTPPPADATASCPFSGRACCGLCAGSEVFGMQYYNVHVLLAACVLLSVLINEAALGAVMSEEEILSRIADACGCDVASVRLAERLVCETLRFDLDVPRVAVDGLLRRLGAVQTCV